MKKMKKFKILCAIFALIIFMGSSCQLFLGPDPDDSPRGIFNTIWSDFNRTYALFEHKNVDWTAVYNEFDPLITNDLTQAQLFDAMEAMLSRLVDAHVGISGLDHGDYLTSDEKADMPWDHTDYNVINLFDFGLVGLNYVDLKEGFYNYSLSYGRFRDNPNIGYIRILTFDLTEGIFMETGAWAKEIDNILLDLADTVGLVLDLRGNGGGFPSNTDHIQSRFAATTERYMSVRSKTGPGRNDFSTPMWRTISPAGTTYTKPIVMLTNSGSTSCTEMFVLALRTQDHVTHVGSNTTGALSVRIIRPLINGWDYSVSIQITEDLDGKCWERWGEDPEDAGIPPEEIIPAPTWDDLFQNNIDSQLQGALDHLLGLIQ